MLLILMYHRAVEGHYGNPPEVLRSHFAHLRKMYPVTLPGQPLSAGRLNITLTFDDAFADFYAFVFPLLKEFSLPAVLSVPTGFIVPDTNLSMAERLSVPSEEAMRGRTFQIKAPFCTWTEIREMDESGLVVMASHSHQHIDLTKPTTDCRYEVIQSGEVLERRLGKRPLVFVYPFGRVNAQSQAVVKQHYPYAMRIGRALNTTWTPPRQPLCRVGADGVPKIRQILRWDRLAAYRLKWLINRLRAASGKWEAGIIEQSRPAKRFSF